MVAPLLFLDSELHMREKVLPLLAERGLEARIEPDLHEGFRRFRDRSNTYQGVLIGVERAPTEHGESKIFSEHFWKAAVDIAAQMRAERGEIPVGVITLVTDPGFLAQLDDAGIHVLIDRTLPPEKIAEGIMRFCGIVPKESSQDPRINQAFESIATVKYAIDKCRAFLEAPEDDASLAALWHISQLTDLLPPNSLPIILEHAIKSGDTRIRAEACYFAERAGLLNAQVLHLLRDDPNPNVRQAFERLTASKKPKVKRAIIHSSIEEFWNIVVAIPKELELFFPSANTMDKLDSPVAEATKQAFRNWLAAHPAPDEKRFFVGPRSLSARDIVVEVEQETELGVEHVKMLTNWILKQDSKHGN